MLGQKYFTVQFKRTAIRTNVQHQLRHSHTQIGGGLERRFIAHIIGIFLMHDRITRLQNFCGRLTGFHLLNPLCLLAQAFFFFRHRCQRNLNLLVRLTEKLPAPFFTKIDRR